MKKWEDIFKERLEDCELKLPSSDLKAFQERKAHRESNVRKHRSITSLAIGIPSVAAVILVILLCNSLIFKKSQDKQLLASANKEQVAPAPVQNEPDNIEIVNDDADIEEDVMAAVNDEVHWVDLSDSDYPVYQDTSAIEEDIFVTLDGDDWDWESDFVEVIQIPGEEDVYLVLEVSPEFPGGTQALLNYLRENMIYPDSCRNNNIQGRVLVTFIVEKDGSISNPKVVKSVNSLFDAEALRLVSNMPKWVPGTQKGETQRVKYTIPINFRLN
ncbi:MAG: energy transducer TonB [Bacteroidaceae bacterium]|nr:energy transducer TonB [Bacteroidaceae bacterium]